MSSDSLQKCVAVDETVPESQDSITLIAFVMEIILRCEALYGDAPADMPMVGVAFPHRSLRDNKNAVHNDTGVEPRSCDPDDVVYGGMLLVEFAMFLLTCAVGRLTSGFMSVTDATAVLETDAFYDAFRSAPDSRCARDSQVRVDVIDADGRKAQYAHAYTSKPSGASVGGAAPPASSDDTWREECGRHREVSNIRAIAAAGIRAVKAFLIDAEAGKAPDIVHLTFKNWLAGPEPDEIDIAPPPIHCYHFERAERVLNCLYDQYYWKQSDEWRPKPSDDALLLSRGRLLFSHNGRLVASCCRYVRRRASYFLTTVFQVRNHRVANGAAVGPRRPNAFRSSCAVTTHFTTF
jgi:hypothetical protein